MLPLIDAASTVPFRYSIERNCSKAIPHLLAGPCLQECRERSNSIGYLGICCILCARSTICLLHTNEILDHRLREIEGREHEDKTSRRQPDARVAPSFRAWAVYLLSPPIEPCSVGDLRRSSTGAVYRGKILERSPRNFARYAVISPATILKSRIFRERMS